MNEDLKIFLIFMFAVIVSICIGFPLGIWLNNVLGDYPISVLYVIKEFFVILLA